jgi:hypothetical protein
MNLAKNIKIVDLALLINKKILILSDIHFGYEDSLIEQGYLIPRHQYEDTLKKVKNILKQTNPKTIIINGDLKHQFGSILKQEFNDSVNFLKFLQKKYKIILIKGNHDKILNIIADKVNLKTQDYCLIEDTYIFHGDFIPEDNDFKKAKTIIIGHEHPAISLQNNMRYEKYKCFLKGKYKNKTLIVQPSLNLLTIGTDVLKEKIQSPLIKNIEKFEVFVSEDKVYNFGKIISLLDFKDI